MLSLTMTELAGVADVLSCVDCGQGEARFMAIAGKDKRTFFSLQAAGDLVAPVIGAVDAKDFDATKFQVRRSKWRSLYCMRRSPELRPSVAEVSIAGYISIRPDALPAQRFRNIKKQNIKSTEHAVLLRVY